MKRSKPLARGKPLRRSAKPIARKKRLAPRSKKQRDVYERPGGRRDFVRRILSERPTCEAGRIIGCYTGDYTGTDATWNRCTRRSVDVHEILSRSAGGSILDESNVMAVCRACHDFAGRMPKVHAFELGLRRSRYEGRRAAQQINSTEREQA